MGETIDGFELADIVEKQTGKVAPAYAAIPEGVRETLKAQRAMGRGASTRRLPSEREMEGIVRFISCFSFRVKRPGYTW